MWNADAPLPLHVVAVALMDTWHARMHIRLRRHLHFAHGGTADFKGRHGAYYNFFSAPGFSVSVKTEESPHRGLQLPWPCLIPPRRASGRHL